MSNILEEMETEAIKSDAADSLGDARGQLQKLIKLERISIAATAGIVGVALVLGQPWLIAAAGITSPTALFPPLTGAAKKMTAKKREHLIMLIWAECAQKGGVVLFVFLMILYGLGSFWTNATALTSAVILFMIYRSFSKIRVYKKTMRHVAVQQNNLS